MCTNTAMIIGASCDVAASCAIAGDVVPGLLNKFLAISPELAP